MRGADAQPSPPPGARVAARGFPAQLPRGAARGQGEAARRLAAAPLPAARTPFIHVVRKGGVAGDEDLRYLKSSRPWTWLFTLGQASFTSSRTLFEDLGVGAETSSPPAALT